MRTFPRHTGVVAVALVSVAAGVLLGLSGWPQPNRTFEFAGLILAAVLAYCIVKSALVDIVVPFVLRQPIDRRWPKSILRGGPSYLIGASLAVGFVELIDHRMWEVFPVAAAPLYFAYRAYCAHVTR